MISSNRGTVKEDETTDDGGSNSDTVEDEMRPRYPLERTGYKSSG